MFDKSQNSELDGSNSAVNISRQHISIAYRKLGGRFRSHGVELPLGNFESKAAAILAEKIRTGVYQSSMHPCQGCGQGMFTCLADSDRYAIPAFFSLCDTCGLATFNPRINSDARKDFFPITCWSYYTRIVIRLSDLH